MENFDCLMLPLKIGKHSKWALEKSPEKHPFGLELSALCMIKIFRGGRGGGWGGGSSERCLKWGGGGH